MKKKITTKTKPPVHHYDGEPMSPRSVKAQYAMDYMDYPERLDMHDLNTLGIAHRAVDFHTFDRF